MCSNNIVGEERVVIILVLEAGMEIGNVPCGIGHIKPAENGADSLLIRSGTVTNMAYRHTISWLAQQSVVQ